MKRNYTAEIENHPETRVEADYNVQGGSTETHRDLAERAAISAAMSLAEEKADGWQAGPKADEYLADTEDGVKSHTLSAHLRGDEWGENWSGTVTVDGKTHNVSVH